MRSEPKLDADIRSYCQKAESLHAALPVAGFVTQLEVPIDIEIAPGTSRVHLNLRLVLNLKRR